MVKAFTEILRDFATDGVPSSGPHQPIKADFREALTAVEAFSNASGSALVYQDRATLFADLAHAANTMAWVVNDATTAYNGVYEKSGASGAGSWTRVADLPYSFIVATNVGAGTATAIQATTAIPVTSSALVLLPIVATASSSPITVSFNGDTALTIKTVSGNSASALTTGMWILGTVTGSDFRMLNDQDVAALVAQAEVAKDQAEAAAYRKTLTSYGAIGDGTTNDTAAINTALAAGVPLTGAGRTYAVTGKISLPANTSLWDVTFKQLSPGASLNVITLEASNVSGIDLRRVKVDRNGDGTNGGLLDASGTNGALNTAFGMRFAACTNSHFEDLEVYGNDSGTGILFTQIGETSRIIRPYVHNIGWSRTTATDDQVQGISFDQCTRSTIEAPRVINLTGILNGVASRRYTRGISCGGSTGLTISDPYVEHADQGVDITGSPATNADIVVDRPVVKDIWVWGVKLANTARRAVVRSGRAYDCGVGFVASPASALTSDLTTNSCEFVDCIAYNTGSNGQTVVSIAGFRVLEQAATLAGRAANIRFVRCKAIDEQTVPTMATGFSSEITDITVAPILVDCTSVGHTTQATGGLFRSYVGAVGNVSQTSGVATGAIVETGGALATGIYTKFIDGTMITRFTIDDTAGAWTTADGALFISTATLNLTFPVAFVGSNPVISATCYRGAIATGVTIVAVGLNGVNLTPWISQSTAAGNVKHVHVTAIGRWF